MWCERPLVSLIRVQLCKTIRSLLCVFKIRLRSLQLFSKVASTQLTLMRWRDSLQLKRDIWHHVQLGSAVTGERTTRLSYGGGKE